MDSQVTSEKSKIGEVAAGDRISRKPISQGGRQLRIQEIELESLNDLLI